MERERRLVAVVTVRDHEPGVREVRAFVHPPEPRAVRLQVGLAPGQGHGRPVVEEEDRLELRPHRAQETEALGFRPRVRELVREDDALLVRLDSQRGDEAVSRPLDAVGADVALRERPQRRLVVADENPVALPVREVARRLDLRLGKRQVHDVVRAPREVVAALLGGDDVVGGRDEAIERPGLALVVPERTEGLHNGHRTEPNIRLRT